MWEMSAKVYDDIASSLESALISATPAVTWRVCRLEERRRNVLVFREITGDNREESNVLVDAVSGFTVMARLPLSVGELRGRVELSTAMATMPLSDVADLVINSYLADVCQAIKEWRPDKVSKCLSN